VDVTTEGFVWALGSLCRLHRIAFDPALVRKQFPPPHDLASLVRAAQACGLRAGLAGARAEALRGLPLPCLGFARTAGPALLLRVEGEELVYLPSGADAPRKLLVKEFAEQFEPWVLLATPAPEKVDPATEKKALDLVESLSEQVSNLHSPSNPGRPWSPFIFRK